MTELSETVFRMPGMSMALVEAYARSFVDTYEPSHLHRPGRLSLLRIVEEELEAHGVYFTPATADELDGRLAATDPADSGDGSINVLIDSAMWNNWLLGGRMAHRARATVAHELGHVVLHVPVIRRRLRGSSGGTLNRMNRNKVKSYEDPEWQAWAFAGAVLMPRKMLKRLAGYPLRDVAEVFGVSESMLCSHLRRLRLNFTGGYLHRSA